MVQCKKILSSLGERLVDLTQMKHLVLSLLCKYIMRGHGNSIFMPSSVVGEGSC